MKITLEIPEHDSIYHGFSVAVLATSHSHFLSYLGLSPQVIETILKLY